MPAPPSLLHALVSCIYDNDVGAPYKGPQLEGNSQGSSWSRLPVGLVENFVVTVLKFIFSHQHSPASFAVPQAHPHIHMFIPRAFPVKLLHINLHLSLLPATNNFKENIEECSRSLPSKEISAFGY